MKPPPDERLCVFRLPDTAHPTPADVLGPPPRSKILHTNPAGPGSVFTHPPVDILCQRVTTVFIVFLPHLVQ